MSEDSYRWSGLALIMEQALALRSGRRDDDLAGVIYDRVMASGQFFDDDFKTAVRQAGARARTETLQAGVPVFYRDARRNLDIMEHSSGRKFEIRFLNNASGDQNYEVLRELDETAA